VYKEYDDRKALPLFKVLMVGPAADWLESMLEDKTKDYKVLQKAFDERFQTPDVVKFKSAKAIFSMRQADEKNVDEFCESMLKLGRRVEVDEAMLRYIRYFKRVKARNCSVRNTAKNDDDGATFGGGPCGRINSPQ